MRERHDNNFTILRLGFALMVVAGHFFWLSEPDDVARTEASPLTGFGLLAFFVSSGYLVTAGWQRERDFRVFEARRLLRVYPLYGAVVLLQAAVMTGLNLRAGTFEFVDLLRYVGWNAVFANFMAPQMGGLLDGLANHAVNPSLWTLKLELMFYLILPLLHRSFERFGWWVVVALFVVSTVFALATVDDRPVWSRQLPGQLRFFLVGMALHYGDARLKALIARHRFAVVAMAPVAILLGTLPLFGNQTLFLAGQPIWVALAVYIIAFGLPVPVEPLDLSYGIYLAHGPIIQLSLLTKIHSPDLGGLVATIAVATLVAYFGNKWIEQPAIDRGRRMFRRRSSESRDATDRVNVDPSASRGGSGFSRRDEFAHSPSHNGE